MSNRALVRRQGFDNFVIQKALSCEFYTSSLTLAQLKSVFADTE